jgi:hypothetical protein
MGEGKGNGAQPASEYETDQLHLLLQGTVNVRSDTVASLEVFEEGNLYMRYGTRGADVLFHIHMPQYPDNIQEILTECFQEQVGSIQGVEVDLVDTSGFEEKPHFIFIIARGWANNPLAEDKLGLPFVEAFRRRILQ